MLPSSEISQLCTEMSQFLENGSLVKMEFLFKKSEKVYESSCCSNHSCFLLDCCIGGILSAVENAPNNTAQIFEASAALKRTLTIIRDSSNLKLSTHYEEAILAYIKKYWDFVMDVVCHECSDIFSLLMELHLSNCESCKCNIGCPWGSAVAQSLFEVGTICRSRFKCVVILSRLNPALTKTWNTSTFINSIYDNLGNPSLSVVLSEFITMDLETRQDRWQLHIQNVLGRLANGASGLRAALIERLLPKIAKSALLSRDFLSSLMTHLQDMDCSKEEALSAILSIVKFVIFAQKRCDVYKVWSDFVHRKVMARALLHSSTQIRHAAWMLLCEHPKRTQIVTAEDCTLFSVFITSNMTEQSPAMRQKILSSFKKLLIRLCEVGEAVARGRLPGGEELLTYYVLLIQKITTLAFESLAPGANFCRRLTALSIIDMVFNGEMLETDGKVELKTRLGLSAMLTSTRQSLLVGCLDDSFQLCQAAALQLLKSLRFEHDMDYESFLVDTMEQMLSIRSHDTLSSGYRFRFLIHNMPKLGQTLIEQMISLCEERLLLFHGEGISLICTNTLHPILNTIELLLGEEKLGNLTDAGNEWWRNIWSNRLLPLCMQVASRVRPVVHSLSPEGYIPDELLENMTKQGGAAATRAYAETAQLLLACCWRAHKHVSGILSWAATNLPFPSLLSPTELSSIGEYYWVELTECKHCGAFESAVEGFEALCRRLWHIKGEGLPDPMQWLNNILDALDGIEDIDSLCSTRRSAGLPHLICAICATEPSDGKALSVALDRLMNMTVKTESYRVHSLNVLKAVFSNSKLGERVPPALEEAVRIAVHGCSASSWAERNSSAQLVSALRMRVFGVSRSVQRDLHVDQKNRMSGFEFFSRFPSLYPFLHSHISNEPDEFSVYPALIILTHLFPTAQPQYALAPFVPVVLKVLISARAEKLRRLAVAALHAISTQEDLLFLLSWVDSQDLSTITQNNLDGVLHFMLTVLETNPDFSDGEKIVRRITLTILEGKIYQKWCDYVKNHVFLLCNRLSLPINTENVGNVEELTLSRRPLAEFLLSQSSPSNLSSLGIRYEMYRLISLRSLSLTTEWKPLFNEAVNDMRSATAERDLSCILDVIYLNRQLLAKNQCDLIVNYLRSALCANDVRMPETISLARRLCLALSDWVFTIDDVDWLSGCAEEVDEQAMIFALEVAKEALKRPQDADLIPALYEFLQDEELEIRQLASSVLTPLLSSSLENANPAVTRALLLSKYPHLNDNGVEEAVQDETLFDICVRNTYAEPVLFGDFEEKILVE